MRKKMKKKIALLFGGKSGEHEVSVVGARGVVNHSEVMDAFDFELIGINKEGRMRLLSSFPEEASLLFEGEELVPFEVLEALRRVDIAFPLLHGPYGEDVRIQGFLETIGVPYIGCDVLTSALLMDKDMAKRLMKATGIPVVPWVALREGEVIIPRGDVILQAGDRIHVTGKTSDLETFYRSLGASHRRVKSCLIIGGGKITYYLLRMLSHTDMHVKVLEMDREVAKCLAHEFPKVTVIHTDGSEKSNLDEEGIHNYEAVVSLTGMDEENIVISMYASKCNVKKNITKVNRTAIISYLGDIGLMSIITPKRLIANRITRFVRDIENSAGSNVEALYKLADERVESLQFNIKEGSKVEGVPLRELPMRKNIIVAYIVRNGEPIFPGGSDQIEVGDKVIVITTGAQLNDIDDILEK